MELSNLKAPFPYFGGKRRVAHIVWPRFGDTLNYVEPFAGSLAVLLARPYDVRTETVNDLDCYIANFWRATESDPEQVAHHADWPVNEADLHARHLWLVNQDEFRDRMMSDPDYCDPKIAGWWVWGISAWIGSGWCDVSGKSVTKKRQILSGWGDKGVHSIKGPTGTPRPNLRPYQGIEGLSRQRPHVGNMGVHALTRQKPHLNGDSGATGAGIHASAFNRKTGGIYDFMFALSNRLRRTRVCCGDWKRVTGKSVTWKIGTTAVFLDPPYDPNVRQAGLYAQDDKGDTAVPLSTAVREWCLENGDNPKMRIALCGYEAEHGPHIPESWDCVAWKANGGYSNQNKNGNDNASQERIWFSPHCLPDANDIASGITDTADYSMIFEK